MGWREQARIRRERQEAADRDLPGYMHHGSLDEPKGGTVLIVGALLGLMGLVLYLARDADPVLGAIFFAAAGVAFWVARLNRIAHRQKRRDELRSKRPPDSVKWDDSGARGADAPSGDRRQLD